MFKIKQKSFEKVVPAEVILSRTNAWLNREVNMALSLSSIFVSFSELAGYRVAPSLEIEAGERVILVVARMGASTVHGVIFRVSNILETTQLYMYECMTHANICGDTRGALAGLRKGFNVYVICEMRVFPMVAKFIEDWPESEHYRWRMWFSEITWDFSW